VLSERNGRAPVFSAVIPCLDEERAISLIVTAVLVQNVSEVVVIDGTNVSDRHARLQFKLARNLAGLIQRVAMLLVGAAWTDDVRHRALR
jgi:hypothetical protein